MGQMPRFVITEDHFNAASNVPMQIANDPTASNADRLKAAQILVGLMKIVWEDELYTIDLAELAPKAKEKVIYVRYDENFYGNNAHQLDRERAARQAAQEAEERRAAGLPVEEDSESDTSTSDSTSPRPSPHRNTASTQVPTTPPKHRWNEEPPFEPWREEDNPSSSQARGHPP